MTTTAKLRSALAGALDGIAYEYRRARPRLAILVVVTAVVAGFGLDGRLDRLEGRPPAATRAELVAVVDELQAVTALIEANIDTDGALVARLAELGARLDAVDAELDEEAAGPPARAASTAAPAAVRSPAPVGGTTGAATVSSTAYCLTGTMANGQAVYRGAVAGNRWPLGTRLQVSDSPYGPGIFTVADRIGHGSELDFAMPGDCPGARSWGRRTVTVEAVG